MDKRGTYEFRAEPFHCDFTHRLFMGHLGNYMLNAADYHSSERHFGMGYLSTIHKTWVLSRLAVEMEEMPRENERFGITTWVESAMKYFTCRNFRVASPDGSRTLGYGRSVWAMIDTRSRHPQDIFAVNDGSITEWIDAGTPCPIDKISRVKIGDGARLVRTIDTCYSDVDVNGHINSVKYLEHALDLFPLAFYAANRLKRFDIAYVAESHQGDRLSFYVETPEGAADGSGVEAGDGGNAAGEEAFSRPGIYNVRIEKHEENGAKGIEVCRCRLFFVKK